MKLGRESAYAIEGLLVLSKKPLGTAMLLRDIAASRGVPRSFLAKIFQKLTRSGIVSSSRGAIRGPDFFDHCFFWSDRCADSNPCPMHFRWKRVKQQVIGKLMERTTLADLAKRTAA